MKPLLIRAMKASFWMEQPRGNADQIKNGLDHILLVKVFWISFTKSFCDFFHFVKNWFVIFFQNHFVNEIYEVKSQKYTGGGLHTEKTIVCRLVNIKYSVLQPLTSKISRGIWIKSRPCNKQYFLVLREYVITNCFQKLLASRGRSDCACNILFVFRWRHRAQPRYDFYSKTPKRLWFKHDAFFHRMSALTRLPLGQCCHFSMKKSLMLNLAGVFNF